MRGSALRFYACRRLKTRGGGKFVSLLDQLSQPEVWERFCAYRVSHGGEGGFQKDLRRFIDEEGYLPVCARIAAGTPFPLPKKSEVGKLSSEKKRTVYTYPFAENTVLKLLTWLLLRQYDGLFTPNLYSFRPGRGAKDAVRFLSRVPAVRSLYAYKADVSDYFNSVPVERLIPLLKAAVGDDPALFRFLSSLLTEPRALENGTPVTEQKGIMAGTPQASFYANLYLSALDRRFFEAGILYARYSDDMLLLAESREALEARAAVLREFLAEQGLRLNPDKEQFFSPGEGWIFLGFSYRAGTVDIAPASATKLKAKMRRKARALMRWQKRNDLPPEAAAKAFIRVFNSKLFENPAENELTWARWFFPVITTAESLRVIDRYAQDQIRWLLTGTRTKARYNARYEDIKALGYRSLAHEYYLFDKTSDVEN